MSIGRWVMVCVVAVVTMGWLTSAWAEEKAAPAAKDTAAVAAKDVKAQTTCPVMDGKEVNKKLFVDFEGKRIYVCCEGCLPEVKKDPAKYVKLLEEKGITLDKAEAAKAPEAEKK